MRYRFAAYALFLVFAGRAEDAHPPTTAAQRLIRPPQIEFDEALAISTALQWWSDRSTFKTIRYGGFRVKPGGMVAGSGFALGGEFFRDDLAGGQVLIRASGRSSFTGYQLYDAEFALPRLLGEHVFVDLLGTYRNFPRMSYFGPGPDSSKNSRTSYRLEDVAYELTVGVNPFSRLRLGASGGFLQVNVGPGQHSRFLSTEEAFGPVTTPGVDRQSDFITTRGFVDFDYRDSTSGPRSGGYYSATFSNYEDRSLRTGSHRRLDLRAQQYIPFFSKQRVIALRGYTALTEARAGHRIPFYLQPTLGGPDTMRGFHPFRFHDENLLLMNAEYRWKISSGVEMAAFVDSGKVFATRQSLDTRDLMHSYGVGMRFNSRESNFLRVDVGCGNEGCRVWLRFNNFF